MQRIDAILAIEREINGLATEARAAARAERSRPLVDGLESWLREQRGKLSSKADLAKAIGYMLSRWSPFTRFLADGRVCMTNNAAERAIRPLAVGRRNWTFAGSDAGGRRTAAMYTLIETCKLNDIDPRAWLADVLARLPEHRSHRRTAALELEAGPPRTSRGVATALSTLSTRGPHRTDTFHLTEDIPPMVSFFLQAATMRSTTSPIWGFSCQSLKPMLIE